MLKSLDSFKQFYIICKWTDGDGPEVIARKVIGMIIRNKLAAAQKESASDYLKELRSRLDEARRFWRESVNNGMHHEIVDGNFSLYREAVDAYNAQCEKECLKGLLRVAN